MKSPLLRFLAPLFLSLALFPACREAPPQPCGAGELRCEGTCVHPASSAAHCGGCNQACDDGQVCDQGECRLGCLDERAACAGGCVDLSTDPRHCGACETACQAGEECSAGRCRPACGPEQTRCGGSCVRVDDDPAHCGACDAPCPEGMSCVDGSCRCPEGSALCGGGCIETTEDPDHCGACDRRCDPNEVCIAGDCVCPHTQCGARCIDASADRENCGACGNACEGEHRVAAGACVEASCVVQRCEEDFLDCNAQWSDGCEVDGSSEMQHCGACGNDCGRKTGVESATCQLGVCVVTACMEGRGDCNSSGQDGCEIDLDSSVAHCGTCDNNCNRLENVEQTECLDGACVIQSCRFDYADCDLDVENGCEVHLRSDREHCGSCFSETCNARCIDRRCAQVNDLSLGSASSCAILDDGSVWCWGLSGSAGGSPIQSKAPAQVPGLLAASLVAPGANHACAMTVSGTGHCWGNNNNSQLGDGTGESSADPVAILGGTNLIHLASGSNFSCAQKQDKRVWCWGRNNRGQLATGDTEDRYVPTEIPALSGVDALALGTQHGCALKGGELWCWGANHLGQVGNGEREDWSPPSRAGTLTGVVSFAPGSSHTCAATEAGLVYCWGYNWDGQIGNGKKGSQYILEPLLVEGLPPARMVSAGADFTCAVTTDGELWCWGNNDQGQLGNGTWDESTVPVRVPDLEGVRRVALGSLHACALLGEDDLRCWGTNSNGQLGTGKSQSARRPVPVAW